MSDICLSHGYTGFRHNSDPDEKYYKSRVIIGRNVRWLHKAHDRAREAMSYAERVAGRYNRRYCSGS